MKHPQSMIRPMCSGREGFPAISPFGGVVGGLEESGIDFYSNSHQVSCEIRRYKMSVDAQRYSAVCSPVLREEAQRRRKWEGRLGGGMQSGVSLLLPPYHQPSQTDLSAGM